MEAQTDSTLMRTAGPTDGLGQGLAGRTQWSRLAEYFARPAVLLWVGMLLIALLYARTTAFDFVYDDLLIPTAPRLNSWKMVSDVFTHDIFGLQGNAQSVYYRPLAVMWVLSIKQFTAGTPAWFHLFAVAMHLCAFYLAYVLGRLLFRDARLAVFTAMLFALHPTKAESVAWIGSGGCDGLGAIFFFATLICYLKWREQRGAAWYLGSLLGFAAALLTKETLGVAVALVPIHYWLTAVPAKRTLRTAVVAAPYVAVLAVYMSFRHMVLAAPAAMVRTIRPQVNLESLWDAPLTCWWYLRHLVAPAHLGVVYDFTSVPGPTLTDFVLPLVALAVGVAIACWIWFRHRSATVTLLCVWFLLALAPYVAFSPMVRLHDRYLYLAAYPVCALAAYVILPGPNTGAYGRRIRVAVAGIVVLAAASISWQESGYWRNELALWQRATETAPHTVEPWLHVAGFYSGDLGSSKAIDFVDQGLHFRPNSPALWQARGLLLFDRGQFADAREAFLKVVEVSGNYDLRAFLDVMQAKAGAAFYLGRMDLKDGDYASAEKWLRVSVALRPEIPDFHQALAEALKGQGRPDEARQQEALAVKHGG